MELFGKNKAIALDMGQRSIKGVMLTKKKKRIFLKNAFIFDHAESNKSFPNNTDILFGLKAISEVHNLTNQNIIFNMGYHHVNSIDLQLPSMPKKELEFVIKSEVEKAINYKIEKCNYDYLILPNNESSDQNASSKIKVFITKLNIVNAQIKMLESANLKPSILDSDMEAVSRMLHFNNYLKEDHCHIVVDFGETHTTVALLLGRQTLSLSVISQSMGLISHKVSKGISVDYHETEQYKNGLSLKEEDQDILKTSEGAKIANEAFVDIINKVQENIDYLAEFHFKKWPVHSFYFIGGGSRSKGLCEVFEEHNSVPCIVPNPFKNIELEENNTNKSFIFENTNTMATSIGLALRGIA